MSENYPIYYTLIFFIVYPFIWKLLSMIEIWEGSEKPTTFKEALDELHKYNLNEVDGVYPSIYRKS